MCYDFELNDSGLVGQDYEKYCLLFSIRGLHMPEVITTYVDSLFFIVPIPEALVPPKNV
jgi:hypothetical protein